MAEKVSRLMDGNNFMAALEMLGKSSMAADSNLVLAAVSTHGSEDRGSGPMRASASSDKKDSFTEDAIDEAKDRDAITRARVEDAVVEDVTQG